MLVEECWSEDRSHMDRLSTNSSMQPKSDEMYYQFGTGPKQNDGCDNRRSWHLVLC